jgi:hypothetical protein
VSWHCRFGEASVPFGFLFSKTKMRTPVRAGFPLILHFTNFVLAFLINSHNNLLPCLCHQKMQENPYFFV